MKKVIHFIFMMGVVSILIFSVPLIGIDSREKRPAGIDDIMAIKNIPEAQISPDGKHAAFVISEADLKKNIYNSDIWLLASDGEDLFRLTNGPKRDDRPQWAPDGEKIAFVSDRDGKTQIWLISPFGGEARKLTDSESGISSFSWSPDSANVAYLQPDPLSGEEKRIREERGDIIQVDRNIKMVHIHVINVSSGEVRKITEGKYSVDSISWSPDGKKIAFSARPRPVVSDLFKADIYTVSVETGIVKNIVGRNGADVSPQWSPDGKTISFVSMDGRNEWIANWHICIVPPGGGAPRNITKGFDEFISSCTWAPSGKSLYFQANKGVTTQLFSVSVVTGEIRQISSGLRVYRGASFSKTGDGMIFLVSESNTPSEVYYSPVETFMPSRLTRINSHLDEIQLGRTEILRWISYDGMEIEGLLIKPAGNDEKKKYPLLTYIHGGPSGKFGKSFSPQIGGASPVQGESYPLHVLAGEGFAIFLPNPRGSYGYGEKFRMANVGDWGNGDYRDIMTGIDMLIEKGIADPDRLGIMGRSYGGYMTGWIITQTNRFRAASLGAGMSNLLSFYGQTDIPGYMEYYFNGDPWVSKEEYQIRSPVFHAMRVQTPTLIVHGENDMRVPLPQAEEFYRALKKKGVPVEFVIYSGQGHSIRAPKFQRDMMIRNLCWFTRWLEQ